MKNIKNILAIIIVLSFTACEKVVNVDLKTSAPRLVIEGTVSDDGTAATVVLSKSNVFSANNNFPKLSGATVKITDNAGNNFTLTETTSGTYTNTTLVGVVGRTYNLTVVAEGTTYTASSTIPRKMYIDTIIVDTNVPTGTPSGAADKVPGVEFQDSTGFGDNVQIVVNINNSRDRSLYVADDLLTDGGSTPFYVYNPNKKIKTGDSFKAELRSIDKNVYRYMLGINDLQSGNTIPSNPVSNISNGALGYFSAHTSDTKTIIVP
jgi:hypothetical protein